MAFIVADMSIEPIEKLRPLVPRIKACDKSLADQPPSATRNNYEGVPW